MTIESDNQRKESIMRFSSRQAPGHVLATLAGAAVLAALVGTTAACGSDAVNGAVGGPQYLGVCVDPSTGMRVDDSYCGGESPLGAALASRYAWDYINTYAYPNFVMPAYGSRINVTHITVVHTLPRNVTVSRSIPRTGGSATTIRSGLARTSSGPVGGAGVRPGNSAGTGSKVGSGGVSSGTSSSIQRGGFGIPGSGGAGGRGSISGGGISAGG
jgi:hypothetical protein